MIQKINKNEVNNKIALKKKSSYKTNQKKYYLLLVRIMKWINNRYSFVLD